MIHVLQWILLIVWGAIGISYGYVLLKFIRRRRMPAMWHLIGSTALLGLSLMTIQIAQLMHIWWHGWTIIPTKATNVIGGLWTLYALIVVVCGESKVCDKTQEKCVKTWKRIRYGR